MNLRNLSSAKLFAGLALTLATVVPALYAQSTARTFGTVITLGGTPSDIVLDEPRRLLYLVNSAANRVDLFSTATNAVVANIPVGTAPLAAAMSMDGAYLYVTNGASSSVSVIDLQTRFVIQSITVPAAPQGVEVGVDGRARHHSRHCRWCEYPADL